MKKKDKKGELLVYLTNSSGQPVNIEKRVKGESEEVINIEEIYNQPLNISLKSALLENSNIREILPELEIDDNVNLDTRQLKCWVNKESTIQKIAKDSTLQEGVAAKLREDPGNAKGEDGVSPDVREIVTKLITEEKEEFGQMVLDATDGSSQNLATQVAGNSKLQNAVADNSGLRDVVKESLKNDESFQNSIAEELITKKASELSRAILNVERTVSGHEEPALVTDLANNSKFQASVASNGNLQEGVAAKLRENPGNAKGPQGDPGQDGESPTPDAVAAQLLIDENKNTLVTGVAGNHGLQDAVATNLKGDEIFKNAVKGDSGPQGEKGKDANPLEIVNRLKHDSRFKREVRGEKGEQGPKGQDVNPAEVAQDLATDSNKRYNISNEIANDSRFQNAVKYLLNTDGRFKSGVGNVLKSDEDFKKSIKGEKGDPGQDANPAEVAQDLATDSNKRYNISNEIANDSRFQNAVKYLLNIDGRFKSGVGNVLKSDEDFKKSIKGEKGEDGQPGPAGKDGDSPSANAVATELLSDGNKDDLVQAILNTKNGDTEILVNSDVLQQGVAAKLRQNPGLAKGPKGEDANPAKVAEKLADNRSFQNSIAEELIAKKASELSQAILDVKKDNEPALVTDLANNENLQKSVAGNLKNDGGVDVSKIVDSLKPKFTLHKGEKLSEDIYEANVVLDDQTIATLPKIGYYMLNDQLFMHNYATQEKVVIPEEFHYLKVVRLGSGFGNDDYKLTFCNTMGNEFFEYKKYDPEYSRVPDEYKFISLSHAKKEYNPNLSELISHRPLFLIAGELAEQGSDKYAAAVFELTRDGKGKKMATLINEFGYFNQNGEFIHCNYHKEPQCHSYTSAEIDEKYQVTDADSEFYLTKYNDIAIHTIPEL